MEQQVTCAQALLAQHRLHLRALLGVQTRLPDRLRAAASRGHWTAFDLGRAVVLLLKAATGMIAMIATTYALSEATEAVSLLGVAWSPRSVQKGLQRAWASRSRGAGRAVWDSIHVGRLISSTWPGASHARPSLGPQ